MNRTEYSLQKIAALQDVISQPYEAGREARVIARDELAAIECERQSLAEMVNMDWLRAHGGTSDWHMGAISFRGPKCQIDVWVSGHVCVSDFAQTATVCSDFRTMSRGRFLALCSGCGIEVQPVADLPQQQPSSQTPAFWMVSNCSGDYDELFFGDREQAANRALCEIEHTDANSAEIVPMYAGKPETVTFD